MIGKAAKEQNLIQSDKVRSLTAEEVDKTIPHGSVVLGTTAHTSSSRANKYLDWKPVGPSLRDDIPTMVKLVSEKVNKE